MSRAPAMSPPRRMALPGEIGRSFMATRLSQRARPVEDPAWPGRCHGAAFEDDPAVHEDEGPPLRVPMRIFERRCIAYAIRIEDREVRLHARPEEPAIDQPEAGCRKARHLPDGLLERQHMPLANVDGEHTRE